MSNLENEHLLKDKSITHLSTSLLKNVETIKSSLGNSNDIIIREFLIGKPIEVPIAIIYTDGLADNTVITDFILESIISDFEVTTETTLQEIAKRLKTYCLTVGSIKNVSDFPSLFNTILGGETVLLIDGLAKGISTSTKNSKDRAITEPATESVIRGPRESFTETLRTNTALIRRKIKSPNLWIKSKVIGKVTQTEIAVMYINGIANEKIVKEVIHRLDQIDIDGILESGYIEQLIKDSKFTLFPTIYNSERPDVIAGELLEGKIAILVDGTPFVLVVPALFISFLQSAEDYYQNAFVSSFIRLIRFLGISLALVAPSLYISLTTFHHEMIPTPLLISIYAQREGVPFPAFVEALIMEIAFEVLREAGLRMPRMIGPAISIVGTLIIGQAAVEAGIVSAAMVIIVALTAICSFLFPAYGLSNTIRILRFPLMVLAAMLGLFGVFIGLMLLIIHLCSLRSFGVPYMSPFAPLIPKDQKDALIIFPRNFMLTRPRLISQINNKRGRKNGNN
ncbi:spore germination protein [Solibacillus daqui]|uniref:spore germination protein n=1 Tax=Solibacillus daqui TaxID=2912187 RepID=UPI002366B3DC|nr:spore germination protein [Solibacillus daqui]